MIAIGKVFDEFLVIAYGDGLNGKSTFWNTIAKVLGTYSGHLSSEALTMNCNRNIKPEIAEAKNKRILIAGELEEGAKLNSSVVKQLCSTDAIWAEKKFYAPFAFEPTHTLVLYTNHLPKVNTSDYGTWRRLKVIPFNATIEQKQDIKNYSAALFEQAGGAILTWIIQGAQRAIKKQFKIEPPEVVRQAIDNYRNDNDWMFKFINDCCDKVSLDEPAVKPSELFNAYCNYCRATGEAQRSSADFYAKLKSVKWIERKEAHHQVKLRGIKIKEQKQDWSYCTGINFTIGGSQTYKAADIDLEGDWSAAANFLVGGAIFGGVELSGLDTTSLQADISIMDVLVEAGAALAYEDDVVSVRKAPLEAFDFDLSHAPDIFPIVSVLAAFCAGTTTLAGVSRLRGKESDRAAAILEMLSGFGVHARIDGDELQIEGETLTSRLLGGRLLRGGKFSSHHDHRMAMAIRIASIGADGPVTIDDPACVTKSFPDFFEQFS